MASCLSCKCEVPLYAMADGLNGESTVCMDCSQSLAGGMARRALPIRLAIAKHERKGKR